MARQITDEPITGDATQNLRLGYYFYTDGVLAVLEDQDGVPMPSNYREPVPPLVNGLFMYVHPDIRKTDSIETFKDGKNTIPIKQVNLVWLLFLQIGVGLLLYAVTKNQFWPFLGWFLVLFYFIRFGDHFDHLYTEIQAASMIVWTTYFLYQAVIEKKWLGYVTAGLFLGLTTLTKAVFFYLTPCIFIFLFLLHREPDKLKKYAILAVCWLIVVMPWLIRNQILVDDFSITHRGGKVLYNRAIMNDLDSETVKAAVYLWGPQMYKDIVAYTSLSVDTIEFNTGGKFEKLVRYPESDSLALKSLDPNQAVSLHSKMRILADSLSYEFRQQGMNREEARVKGIGMLQEKGKEMILDKPLDHIRSIPLFFWRGAWPFPNSTIPLIDGKLQIYINNFFNIIAFLSIFFLPLWGLFRHRIGWIVISIMPASMILFHTMISHNIPRYSESAIPSMLICLTIGTAVLFHRWYPGLKSKLFRAS
jgi:hypothetical protein